MKHEILFTLNGRDVKIFVDCHSRLIDILRDVLGLTGTKEGCGEGECGACTVIVNGKAVNSCLFPALEAEGKSVVTIEGLACPESQMTVIQHSFVENGAIQCGFCTPGMILSAYALLERNPDPTDEEIREAIAGNLCRCTGYAQIIQSIRKAAQMLRSANTRFCYMGREAPRPEGLDKATGKTLYIHDLKRPGMLYGKIRFSDFAHARIINIDTSRAERLPGVRAVITAYDTPEIRFGFLRDNTALKKGRVRQYRDEIAAVAAIDPDIAEEALSLISVEYEPLPSLFSPAEALREGAILIHETDPKGKKRSDNLLPLKYHHESGDLERGMRRAKFSVEGEYSTQRVQHSALGTAGCIAELDSKGNLTIWSRTQIPFLAQRDFNQALSSLGLAGKNSRVIVPAIGGAFGAGLDTYPHEYIAILLSFKTGQPVKIVYSREEEFSYLSPRQSSISKISQGCDENGRLTFRRVEALLDNGAYTSWGATYPTVMMIPATSLYRVESIFFDARLVYTNNIYCQAMRGYGNPEITFALESNMDELAIAAGIDPIQFRKINSNSPGEITPMGLKISTCGLPECIEKVGDALDRKNRGESCNSRGVGMASLIHVGGGARIYRSDASGILMKLDDFGNLNLFYGGVEMGQGLHAAIAVAVSEALGISPERIFINPTDTGTSPWDVGTHASRGAFMACNAAILAAGKLREKIFEFAAALYPALISKSLAREKNLRIPLPELDTQEFESSDFDLRNDRVFPKSLREEPGAHLELGQLLRAAHYRDQGEMLIAEAFYDPPNELPDFEKGWGNISATYTYGAQGVEVEVDPETGNVKILRLAASTDVGKVLSPETLRGQMYGALAQGVGFALYENIALHEGRVLNPGFRDYKIPTAWEMNFPVDLTFIETNDPFGPFGAKGVGEAGLIPTAPAIANAIYDAVGVRIRELPITAEKILAALDKKKGEQNGYTS